MLSKKFERKIVNFLVVLILILVMQISLIYSQTLAENELEIISTNVQEIESNSEKKFIFNEGGIVRFSTGRTFVGIQSVSEDRKAEIVFDPKGDVISSDFTTLKTGSENMKFIFYTE